MLKFYCEHCDFNRELSLSEAQLRVAYDRQFMLMYERENLRRVYMPLHEIFEKFYEHHTDNNTHHSCLIVFPHEVYENARKMQVNMGSFIKQSSQRRFSEMLTEYIIAQIYKAEAIRHELEAIESMVETPDDSNSVQEFREQGLSNYEIINRLYDMLNKRNSMPKEGQVHLELDEATIESTGKSTSIDELIAKIEKVQKEYDAEHTFHTPE